MPRGIPKSLYFHLLDIGIPYEGPVIGLGYALREVKVTSSTIGSETFKHLLSINVCVPDATRVEKQTLEPTPVERGFWIRRGKDVFFDRDFTNYDSVTKKYGSNSDVLMANSKVGDYTLNRGGSGSITDLRTGKEIPNDVTFMADGYIVYATCDHCVNVGVDNKPRRNNPYND